jgi:transposase
MPQAYSNDLRRKFLQAYDEGEGTLEELAEQFRVSLAWARKISARRFRTGEVEAPVWRHGPVSRVTPEVQARKSPHSSHAGFPKGSTR